MEKITTVLFDLDGTLIPFDQKEFIESYLHLISKKFVPMGYDKDMLIKALWDGTGNMIKKNMTKWKMISWSFMKKNLTM